MEKVIVCFHGNANAPNLVSHFKTVGPVVAVDVVPVVVVEVVVVAGQKAQQRSPCIFKLSPRLHFFGPFGLTMCCHPLFRRLRKRGAFLRPTNFFRKFGTPNHIVIRREAKRALYFMAWQKPSTMQARVAPRFSWGKNR